MTRFAVVVGLGSLSVSMAGQAPAPAGPQPILRTSVDQVVVDVVVTDAAGAPVAGLAAADFELREGGRAQALSTVVEIGAAPTVRATEAASTGPAAATAPAGGEPRVYVLLLDDYHVAFSRSADVRAAARAFVDRHVAPDDRVGVLTASGLGGAAADPTADRERVRVAIAQFVGRGGAPVSPVAASYRRGSGGRNADRMASQRTSPLSTYDPGEDVGAEGIARGFDALRALARAAEALAVVPGRKSVLYISEGVAIPIDNDQGLNAAVAGTLAAAARSNVAIYAFDPRGLSHLDPNALGGSGDQLAARVGQANRDRLNAAAMLEALALRSGGLAFIDRNDSAAALARVGRDSRHHYLLGYVPADTRRDGRFRSIDVQVSRPGVSVRARQGYVAAKERR